MPVRSGRVECRTKVCQSYVRQLSAHVTSIHEAGLKYMRCEINVAAFLRIQVFWAKAVTRKYEKLTKVKSQ
jgi:uncharacterized protein YigE (DUF2233 family)